MDNESPKKKRILIFLSALHMGGAERKILNILNSFSSPKYQLSLCVFTPEGNLLDDFIEAGFTNYPLPFWLKAICFPLKLWPLLHTVVIGRYNIRQALKNLNPDIALTITLNTTVPMAFCVKLLKRQDIKWIMGEESNNTGWAQMLLKYKLAFSIYNKIVGSIYRKADHIIAVSQGLKASLNKDYQVPLSDISVIYNPIDINKILTHSRETPSFSCNSDYIFAMGRLVNLKNFSLLIEAFTKINKSFPNLCLIIAGVGPEEKKLKKLAKKYKISSKVLFPGYIKNPWSLLKNAQLAVVSSKVEGFCNVIIEAMALGCPVVSTACNYGPLELIEDNISGKLVPVDNPDLLASEISSLLSNKDLRKKLADNGKKFSSEFSLPLIVEKYEKIFTLVMDLDD